MDRLDSKRGWAESAELLNDIAQCRRDAGDRYEYNPTVDELYADTADWLEEQFKSGNGLWDYMNMGENQGKTEDIRRQFCFAMRCGPEVREKALADLGRMLVDCTVVDLQERVKEEMEKRYA